MVNDCEKACIYTFGGILLAEATVVDSDKEDIGLIVKEEDVKKISMTMVVVFYDGKKGLVTCECRQFSKTKLAEEAAYQLTCRIEKRISEEERRRELKIKIEFPVILEIFDAEANKDHVQVLVKDISAGGIGFESDTELQEEQLFSFLVDLPHFCFRLKGRIIWKKKVSEGDKAIFRYGSSFYEMNTYQDSMVRKFISAHWGK